jgi:hypothetical protein
MQSGATSTDASAKANATETCEGAVAEDTARKVEGLPSVDQNVISMNMNLVAASLIIKEPGVIRVRAALKNELIRLGSIRVVRAAQQVATQDANQDTSKS